MGGGLTIHVLPIPRLAFGEPGDGCLKALRPGFLAFGLAEPFDVFPFVAGGKVVESLHKFWLAAGVQMVPEFLSSADFQGTLSQHNYEAVLYGISIGVDPDVFVYWDSSQADVRSSNRLNLSEYKNATADAALEAGRTRTNPALRVVKYKPFLTAWQQDNPALGLYQPRSLYLTNGTVYGLNVHTLNSPTDRYSNVENWKIRLAKVTN